MPYRPFTTPMKASRGGTTIEWYPSDSKENMNKNPDKELWKGVDITYAFNSDGYRCDEFVVPTSGPRVMFSGCSFTEGIGLRLEDVWSHRIRNRINSTFGLDVPYWSVALGGTGLDHQHRALFQHVPILKPNLLFLQMPELSRRERWEGDFFGPWSDDLDQREWRGFLNEDYVAFQTSKNLNLIEDLLVRNNTKCCILLPMVFNDLTPGIGIKSLIPLIPSTWYVCRKPFVMYDKARDGMHFGPESHRVWAELIWDDISDELSGWLGL